MVCFCNEVLATPLGSVVRIHLTKQYIAAQYMYVDSPHFGVNNILFSWFKIIAYKPSIKVSVIRQQVSAYV